MVGCKKGNTRGVETNLEITIKIWVKDDRGYVEYRRWARYKTYV